VELRILLALACAFALGAVVIAVAGSSPRNRTLVAELWRLYRAECLVVALVLVPAASGIAIFFIALLGFGWRGQVEMARLFGVAEFDGLMRATLLCGAAMIAAGTFFGVAALWIVAAASLAGLTAATMPFRANPRTTRSALVAGGILVLPMLLLGHIGALRAGTDGFRWIVLVYAVVEVNDSFALLFGKLLGRWRPLPRLSPHKTGEGFLAGALCGGAAGLVLAPSLLGLAPFPATCLVAVILFAGLLGDLLTSALKRWQGRKDFAPLHPAMGGALDIYDSFLFAAPVVLYLRNAFL